MRHQGDVRFGHQRWPERQLYDVVLTSGFGWAVSLIRRRLFCRANWRFRPFGDIQSAELGASKQPFGSVQSHPKVVSL
jgi:hypothetical protein